MTLSIVVFLFVIGTLLELVLFFSKKAWKRHKQYIRLVWLFNILCFVGVLFVPVSAFTVILGISFIYKYINNKRIRLSRLPDLHLKSITKHSFIKLSVIQALLIIFEVLFFALGIGLNAQIIIGIITVVSLLNAIIVTLATLSNVVGSRPRLAEHLSDDELPTVTVAIAARNETPMLTDCLNSVISSDYPKLEVLVLDDDSQDTTADIIKSFAHDGVRFIRSEKPNGTWLAKNRAYESLLQHASGEYILFMGVDVQLYPSSIRRIAEQIVGRNLDMITMVPKRVKSGLVASFIQPIRYWWELALPRIYLHRPPALSTSWMIKRASLISIGGFTTYKRSITPEEHLAKHFDSIGSYAFVRSTHDMALTTQKNFLSQWDTQVRTRYPHAHRRPENAFIQSFLLIAFCVLPFVMVLAYLLPGSQSAFEPVLWFTVALLMYSHVHVSAVTNPAAAIIAPINFPLAIVLDVVALHVSMIRYEFYRVIWKGRDVTPKKLTAIPRLPALEDTTVASSGSETKR